MDYRITAQGRDDGPWHRVDAGRLPLAEAEAAAYRFRTEQETDIHAVRLTDGEHEFTWLADDDGKPADGHHGRTDVRINGRWYQYWRSADISSFDDAEDLALKARDIPEVEETRFGGLTYGEPGSGLGWSRDDDND